jgi:hypothetical protein
MASAVRSLQSIALNPNIVGVLLFVLERGPARLREPLLAALSSRLSAVAIQRLIKVLKVLWVVGIAGKVNSKLSEWALNSWQWRSQKSKWTWSWEIAVVTGGCSGIGKEIVKNLAKAGVSVAVLDVSPLPEDLERSTQSCSLLMEALGLTKSRLQGNIFQMRCHVAIFHCRSSKGCSLATRKPDYSREQCRHWTAACHPRHHQ